VHNEAKTLHKETRNTTNDNKSDLTASRSATMHTTIRFGVVLFILQLLIPRLPFFAFVLNTSFIGLLLITSIKLVGRKEIQVGRKSLDHSYVPAQ